jgi:hypothetical protein
LETALMALPEYLTPVIAYVGTPTAFILALGTFVWRVSRARLLSRAGSAAIKHGDENPQGRAGLEIVKTLTGENEPWYRAVWPWRRSDDGEP